MSAAAAGSTAASAAASGAHAASANASFIPPQLFDAVCPLCCTIRAGEPNQQRPHALLRQSTHEVYLDEDSPERRTEWHQRVQCLSCHSTRWRVVAGSYSTQQEDDEAAVWEYDMDVSEGAPARFAVIEPGYDGWQPAKRGPEAAAVTESHILENTGDFDGWWQRKREIFNSGSEADATAGVFLDQQLTRRLPPPILSMALQVQAAAASESWHLWMAGLRMLLELVIRELGIHAGNLDQAIQKLPTVVPPEIPPEFCEPLRAVLHEMHIIRHYGNDAVHQLQAPASEQRSIIFHLMRTLLRIKFQFPAERREAVASIGKALASAGVGLQKHPKHQSKPSS